MIIYSTYSRNMSEFGGSALRLIRSYFSDRTQRVQIDGIMSDFASLLLWGATGLSSGTNEILFVFASTWCDT